MTQNNGGPPTDAAEWQRRAQTAEEALRLASQALAERDALIAAIGREMGNRLAPVTLGVERLRALSQRGDLAGIAAGIDLVERACDALSWRSRLLLDYAELSARPSMVTLQPVDLSAMLASIAGRSEKLARRAGCSLTLTPAPGVMVMADHIGLDHIIGELLANAFRFGAGHPIDISISADASGPDGAGPYGGAQGAGRAIVSIRDRGPGVPQALQGDLSSLLNNPRGAETPGLGIGLRVAGAWAGAMGGLLRLAQADGGGACFTLSLGVWRGGS
jgi:signal transduction histidine kinase